MKTHIMIATLFGKKKLTSEQLSNIFVNGVIDAVDKSFPTVADFINEAPDFVASPNISSEDSDKFLMIVLAANMSQLQKRFSAEEEYIVKKKIIDKFSLVYDITPAEFSIHLEKFTHLLYRVKERSNNVLYAMSKAVFFKYNLASFQDEYFKEMKTPNPVFLRRLDQVMKNFLWNWDAYFDKYKIG